MKGGMREFLDAVAKRESGGDHTVLNRSGYVGKYQFGEATLIDLGYYISDKSDYTNNWRGEWTGKDGINSLADFRKSPSAQDKAGAAWFKTLCSRANKMGLRKYIGRTIKGIEITESGILGGMHLVGAGTKKKPAGVSIFLMSDGKSDPADGMGTRASDYVRLFGGYNLGCHAGNLNLTVQDRSRQPVSGVRYEVRSQGRVLQNGRTTQTGEIKQPIHQISFSSTVDFWIERLQGGFKQVWSGVIGSSEHHVVLRSPKVKVVGQTRPHDIANGSHATRTQDAQRTGIHIVKSGDSLSAIARAHGTNVNALRKLNPSVATSDLIYPDQQIRVRSTTRTISVKQGDRLSEIAARNGTTVTEIQQANPGIRNPDNIFPGQEIKLPDGQVSSRSNGGASTSGPKSDSPTSTRVGAIETRNDRTPKGPITIVRETRPDRPVFPDKVKRMLDILDMNVQYGGGPKPSGPAAAIKARENKPISAREKPARKSVSLCYLYVKVALLASDMTGRYLPSQAAKNAGQDLKSEGFHNLLDNPAHGIKSPYDAPVGSIIVYGVTDGSQWGHIEVRTAKGEFASDYKSPNSRVMRLGEAPTMIGRGRKVIGVWVKS